MTSNSCVVSITDTLSELPGITSVDVELAHNRAQVDHATTLPANQLADVMEEMGFGATVVATSFQDAEPEPLAVVVLAIQHMTCSSCTNAIEDAINEQAAVSSVSVDLKTERGMRLILVLYFV